MRILSVIIGLIWVFLSGCATTNMVADLYKINSSTTKIRQIYDKYKNELTPEEREALKEAWQTWLNIWETLDANGCGLKHITKDVCKLDTFTVQELYDSAKTVYLRIRPIAKKREKILSMQERIVLKQFDQSMKDFSESVKAFLANPNAENQLLVIKGLSGLAVVGAKVSPMIIGIL